MATQSIAYQVNECFTILKNLWIKPKYTELYITNEAWLKLNAFINLVGEYEVSGFGRVVKKKDSDGVEHDYVVDFDIIEQEVKSAYVESSAQAVAKFMMALPKDQITEWTLDWHSHVRMATSPSGTDWSNYKDMLEARMGEQFPIMIVNKKGEVTSFDIISENRHESIKIFVLQADMEETKIREIYNECKDKVQSKCTKAAPVVYSTYSNSTYTSGNSRVANTTKKYNPSRTSWWEKNNYYEDGYDFDDEDDEDEEIKAAKEMGYVFDDEVDSTDYCPDCGAELKTPAEKNLGYCNSCWLKTNSFGY